MQTAAVGGTEPLCQLLVPLILEGGETVERQQFLPDGFEIVFMLPVAIVIRVALSCQGVRLQGEVCLFAEHGLSRRQQPAPDAPALEVRVGVGNLRHLCP